MIEEITKLILRKERMYLNASNSLLVQRKVVDVIAKKENDPKTLKNTVDFYTVLNLQNVGRPDKTASSTFRRSSSPGSRPTS